MVCVPRGRVIGDQPPLSPLLNRKGMVVVTWLCLSAFLSNTRGWRAPSFLTLVFAYAHPYLPMIPCDPMAPASSLGGLWSCLVHGIDHVSLEHLTFTVISTIEWVYPEIHEPTIQSTSVRANWKLHPIEEWFWRRTPSLRLIDSWIHMSSCLQLISFFSFCQ